MRFLPLVLLLIVSCVATAQTFKEGSIRLKDGQEQAGLIGKVRAGMPDGVEFKSNADGEIQVLYANEIEGYTLENIFYTSFHQNLYRDRDWIFVELLAQGDVTLIRRNNMYFLRGKDRVEFLHLTNHRQLMKMTRSCPVVSVRGGSVRFNKQQLATFVKEYNECVASKKPNLERMPRPVSLGVQFGYDYTTPKFRDNPAGKFLSASKQYDKSLFQGGVELNFKHYKISSVVGLYTGLIINSDSYAATNRSVDKSGSEVNQYSFGYKELKVPIGLEFSKPSRKNLTLFVRGGAMVPKVLSFKSDHPYSEVLTTNGTVVNYTEPSQMTSYKITAMWGGSIGLDYVIMSSRLRVQAGAYAGKATATVVSSGVATDINATRYSFNFTMTYIF